MNDITTMYKIYFITPDQQQRARANLKTYATSESAIVAAAELFEIHPDWELTIDEQRKSVRTIRLSSLMD